MTNVSKRTFSLTKQQSDYLDSEVASGGYVSSSELIREGIRLLQERDTRFKNWLVEEVGPATMNGLPTLTMSLAWTRPLTN